MTTCEQCGNEYFRKPLRDEETGKLFTTCPYCRQRNNLPPKMKKRGGKK